MGRPALPAQAGLNLVCHRQLGLILPVSLPNNQVELVCMLLVLLSRESHQTVLWGVGWAHWWEGQQLRSFTMAAVKPFAY